jgi:hypothetical protein
MLSGVESLGSEVFALSRGGGSLFKRSHDKPTF